MSITKINSASKSQPIQKLTKNVHSKMLELLKKMHAQDTFERTQTEVRATAVNEITTRNLRLTTGKLPVMRKSAADADEFVKNGQTTIRLNPYSIVKVENKSGKIVQILDDLGQGWENLQKKLANSIGYALKNYEKPSVKKYTCSIRATV